MDRKLGDQVIEGFAAFGGNANKLLGHFPAPHILADEIQLTPSFERIINRFHLQTHERKTPLDRPLDLIAVLGPVDQKTQNNISCSIIRKFHRVKRYHVKLVSRVGPF